MLGSVAAVLVLAGVLSPLDLPLIDTANVDGYLPWSLWLVAFAGLPLVRSQRAALASTRLSPDSSLGVVVSAPNATDAPHLRP